jgi:hypothetical protein
MTKHFEAGVVDVQAAVLSGQPVPHQGPYGLLLGDDRLHFHPVVVAEATPTGQQILETAGKTPVIEYVLYRFLTDGLLEEVELEEHTDLRSHGVEKFLAFRTSAIYRFELNGHGFEWGATHISGRTLKKLAEVDVAKHDLFEVRSSEEHLVEDKTLIDLAKPGLERFITRPIDITIFVNTRPKQVHQRRIGYWEVVRLAFPEAKPDPKVLYTVTYSHGPHQNPEGNLQNTQLVWIKERMQFNVTQTDQS